MLQRLSLVLIFAIAAVVAAALALGAYLNYGSVRAAYLGQVESRLLAIGKGIVDDIETSISFGIPIAGQETLDPLLARERAADPVLFAIDVMDREGEILHSSDPARVGQVLPLLDAGELQVDLAIINSFGSEAGSVRFIADTSILEHNLDSTASTVRAAAIYALIGAMALALLAVLIMLSSAKRRAAEAGQMAAGEGEDGHGWAFSQVSEEHDRVAGRLNELEAKGEK